MQKLFRSLTVTTLAFALVGCAAQGGPMTNQTGAAAVGGITGGILGASIFHGDSKVAGALGGAILGAMAGGAVGSYMDRQDQMNAEQSMIHTRVGQEASWTNQKSGADYTVRPVREYQANGERCRYAKVTVNIDGKLDTAYKTICRKPGGPWYMR